MRTTQGSVLCASLLAVPGLACDSNGQPEPSPATQAESPSPPSELQESEEPAKAPDEPEVTAIAGAVIEGKLYIQACADTFPCPDLLQPAGEEHCEKLDMGGGGWRLPKKAEVEGMRGLDGLQMTASYHFTSTPFDQDEDQVWIVDPTGAGQATTIPRDRKPFRIRCVSEVRE